MNQTTKIILSILGGIEAVFSTGLPILVTILWIKYSNVIGWSSNVLIIVGICASVFRAIKIGGFLRDN